MIPWCGSAPVLQKLRMKQKDRFHRRTTPSPLCMHLDRLWFSLTLSICTFWLIKGKKQIIFLYITIVVFLCYTTISPMSLFNYTLVKLYDTTTKTKEMVFAFKGYIELLLCPLLVSVFFSLFMELKKKQSLLFCLWYNSAPVFRFFFSSLLIVSPSIYDEWGDSIYTKLGCTIIGYSQHLSFEASSYINVGMSWPAVF